MGRHAGAKMVKKKKFIDKKTALNYEMVHRDQRDPLTADDNAAQNLLKPIDLEQKKKKVQFGEELSREEHARREYQAMKAALRDDMSEYNFPTDGYDYAAPCIPVQLDATQDGVQRRMHRIAVR